MAPLPDSPKPKRQQFRSQYGQPGITVSPQVPTRSIDFKLGRTHVGTPHEDVESMVRGQVAKARLGPEADAWTPKMENETVKYAKWRHSENRAQYEHVMGGHPPEFHDRRQA